MYFVSIPLRGDGFERVVWHTAPLTAHVTLKVSIPLRGDGFERLTEKTNIRMAFLLLFQSPCGEMVLKE